MSNDNGGHDSHKQEAGQIIDEKSIQDKLLSALAAGVLVGLLYLGFYWQTLALPACESETESVSK